MRATVQNRPGVSFHNNPDELVITMTMTNLRSSDSNRYWCAVKKKGFLQTDIRTSLELTVTEGKYVYEMIQNLIYTKFDFHAKCTVVFFLFTFRCPRSVSGQQHVVKWRRRQYYSGVYIQWKTKRFWEEVVQKWRSALMSDGSGWRAFPKRGCADKRYKLWSFSSHTDRTEEDICRLVLVYGRRCAGPSSY